MTVTSLIDLRARGLNALIHPGNPADVTLVWPTGSLADRTFTSTLDGEEVTVTIADDTTMTIEVSAEATGALTVGESVPWELVETTGSASTVLLTGRWATDTDPAKTTGQTFTVDLGGTTIEVAVPGRGELVAHAADDEAHGNPLGALTTHEADTTAHGDPIGELTAHKDKLHLAHITRPAAWGQNRWFTARDEAGARQVKVHLWGDSIYQGVGATSPRTEGCAELIGAELRDRYGDGGTGWLPSALGTTTGTWTSGMGMGGCQSRATATATMKFTDLRGSAIRIFHRNAGKTSSDQFRWRVNGGDYTTVTLPTAFSQDPGAVDIDPGGDGPHTLDIEWVAGTVDIFGVEATFPAGIVTYRFAQSGRAASDYTAGIERKITRVSASGTTTTLTCSSPGSFTDDLTGKHVHGPTQIGAGVTVSSVSSATQLTISAATSGSFSSQTVTFSTGGTAGVLGANMCADPFLAAAVGRPDLVIVQLGANDPAGANNSADTFRAGISKILRLYSQGDALDYTPDFVLVLEHIGNWFDIESEYAAMAAVLADLAGGSGAALVDIWGMGHRSWKYWSDLGWFADAIHPTTAGHQQYAAPVIALLTGD
jgi:lysophospholipase L1-like esterase